MNDKKLTTHQRRFCELRVIHPEWAAAECYRQAYPRCQSGPAAAVGASKLLRNPNVREYVTELCTRAQDQVVVTAGRVLQEEACLAFYDVCDLVNPDTDEIRPPHELPEHFRRAVVAVTITETRSAANPDLIKTEYRYRFADKGKALERLSRYFGLYEKDNRQKPQEAVCNKFVLLPTQRELTLVEWDEQVKEYNRLQAEAKQVESDKKILN